MAMENQSYFSDEPLAEEKAGHFYFFVYFYLSIHALFLDMNSAIKISWCHLKVE